MFGRNLIPISNAAVEEIDAQAISTLRNNLSARKFVDIKGPLGWTCAGVPLGRFDGFEVDGAVGYGVRKSLPLVESRVEFELEVFEMHNIDRGCLDSDLIPLERAAIDASAFEDRVIYNGLKSAGIKGMCNSCDNSPVAIPKADPEGFMKAVIDATCKMKSVASISGPFAFVGGKSLRDALNKIVNGRSLYEIIENNSDINEFIFTPSFDGAFLVSKRGGDFELTIGGDFTIGYTCRDEKNLKLYLIESFAFRVIEPRAYTLLELK